MNILILCKRHPQNKDLLTRPYGRFYYLPKLLAEKGHTITILLHDHKGSENVSINKGNICWNSVGLFPLPFVSYYRKAKIILNKNKFDWIFGFSDTYYGILAQRLAYKFKTKCLIDAYDNYESYIPWLYPLHWAWRNSLQKSDLVSVAGPQLANLFSQLDLHKKPILIPMSADPEFKPLDKKEMRKALNLPQDKYLIGYCGGLYKNRGIDLLFKLIDHFKSQKEIDFIISGRLEKGVKKPDKSLWLGYIDDKDIPILMNCLDVMLVFNKHSNFGEYSYPVKIYEAMACNIPVIAGNTHSVEWILKNNPEMLAEVGIKESYIEKIEEFKNIELNINYKSNWNESCNILENAILSN